MEIHTLTADVQRGRHTVALGGYGAETLCHFILDHAGMTDAPRDQQARTLQAWLLENRPSPLLRADLTANGFAHLLRASISP
ncbi:hypothetical protein [Mycobacterium sp. 236(2023)]|uniref:hypothetical protein n=1 Tax=Mycobacterium sp. 236(2023) TaxID=3038163 RepID=UPI002415399E|nr:hypothetical protein [Mycobacterium sp. 236(2023)]MDG4665469.1 hypothetical protein [Mycobacterium sp. 236(2023)]